MLVQHVNAIMKTYFKKTKTNIKDSKFNPGEADLLWHVVIFKKKEKKKTSVMAAELR